MNPYTEEWRYTEGVVDVLYFAPGEAEGIPAKGRRLQAEVRDQILITEAGYGVDNEDAAWFLWPITPANDTEQTLRRIRAEGIIEEPDTGARWRIIRGNERRAMGDTIGWRAVAVLHFEPTADATRT